MDTPMRDQGQSTSCPVGWSTACRRTTPIIAAQLSPRAVGLVCFVVISSAFDALFTLLYIQQGGSEANPIMALALNQGVAAFVGLKMGLTGLGALLLAIHEHSWLGLRSLQTLALTYSVLLVYHLILFFRYT
jgi:hypothetical protein